MVRQLSLNEDLKNGQLDPKYALSEIRNEYQPRRAQ